MTLYHLTYQSQASDTFTAADLPRLLQQSSHFNCLAGVTGLLLYTPDHRFTQVLEGPREQVRTIYERITVDARNHSCEVLSEGPWARRSFPAWHVSLTDCTLVPQGLPLVCVDLQELPRFLPAVAPTRPMLVHTLLTCVEPFLSSYSY